jgi:hypothetical protein
MARPEDSRRGLRADRDPSAGRRLPAGRALPVSDGLAPGHSLLPPAPQAKGREAGPCLDAAARALGAPEGGEQEDLRGFRIAALAFKLVVRGAHPIAVAQAVDEEGVEHWLAVRAASARREVAYTELLADLVRRGLRVTRPLIVDVDGWTGLAQRLELALDPVPLAGAAREMGGGGLAW